LTKKLALRLCYFDAEGSRSALPEFKAELDTYGRIYVPPGNEMRVHSRISWKCEQAKAIMLMIQNNLIMLWQHPHELILMEAMVLCFKTGSVLIDHAILV
jgi:urocanate hydratase